MGVQIYKSTDVGAPGLNGLAGSLVAVLKACLVDGFGVIPAAGWTMALDDLVNHRMILRNDSVTVTGRYFNIRDDGNTRVDGSQSVTSIATFHGCESFADINTTLGNFPNLNADLNVDYRMDVARGLTVHKSSVADVSLRPWMVVADERTCHRRTSYHGFTQRVPAGALSYSQKTPIQAVSMIAGVVGAKILPHRTAAAIDINPAYPISPWDWAAATPDAILTADVITKLTESWQPKPSLNGVFVAGQNQGVSCFVKRAGSAGDELAQQVIDPLKTHQDACRERGRMVLSDMGVQEINDVYLPLMPPGQEPGLFVSGDLLEIDEGALGAWRALVIATKVSVNITDKEFTVDQILTLERHHL